MQRLIYIHRVVNYYIITSISKQTSDYLLSANYYLLSANILWEVLTGYILDNFVYILDKSVYRVYFQP